MKRLLLFISALFISKLAIADTITINWLKSDKTLNQTTTCTIGGTVTLPSNIESKYGYTFKGFVDNYTPVEYIESTGSQWIDTGVNPNQKTGVKTKIYVGNNSSTTGFFGINSGYTNFNFARLTDGKIKTCFYAGCTNRQEILNVGDILVIDWNKNTQTFYINNRLRQYWLY